MSDIVSGDHIIPDVRLDQTASILAMAMRAALMDAAGDDDDRHIATMAVFLHQLCHQPRHPKKMAGILEAVAASVFPEGESRLDLAWERINALGGKVSQHDEYGVGVNDTVSQALTIIEDLGGDDPLLKRAAAKVAPDA